MRPASLLTTLVGAGALFALVPPGGFADTLHGYCAGVGQCVDNGTNSPTTNNPPINFGFTTSPGPTAGMLTIEVLVPNNEPIPSSFALTTLTLQSPSNPNVSPPENISPDLPLASYIVGFFNEAGSIQATANSGAIFEAGSSVPISGPVLGAALPSLIAACVGLLALARRRRKLVA